MRESMGDNFGVVRGLHYKVEGLSQRVLGLSKQLEKQGGTSKSYLLGTPVVPFFPFYFGVFLLKLTIRKRVPLLLWGYWGA